MHLTDIDMGNLAALEVTPIDQGGRQRLDRFDLLAALADVLFDRRDGALLLSSARLGAQNRRLVTRTAEAMG
jgi:hypothetical protein